MITKAEDFALEAWHKRSIGFPAWNALATHKQSGTTGYGAGDCEQDARELALEDCKDRLSAIT